NPYPPSEKVVADIAAAVAEAARGLNRYPDREFLLLRSDLAAFLTADGGVELTSAQVWAANGSNEVLQQLLQAFGGPGRTALGFTPAYSMHPLIALGTGTGWLDGPRRADFAIDTEAAVAIAREQRPDVVFVCSPNNPTGT